MTSVLAAGDRFMHGGLLAEAVLREVPGADVTTVESPWPDVPFGPVSEVHEALGDEDALIDALAQRQVLVTQMAPVTVRMLAACPSLELVAVTRGGPVKSTSPPPPKPGSRSASRPAATPPPPRR